MSANPLHGTCTFTLSRSRFVGRHCLTGAGRKVSGPRGLLVCKPMSSCVRATQLIFGDLQRPRRACGDCLAYRSFTRPLLVNDKPPVNDLEYRRQTFDTVCSVDAYLGVVGNFHVCLSCVIASLDVCFIPPLPVLSGYSGGSATLERGFWGRAGTRHSQAKAQDLRNGHLASPLYHTLHTESICTPLYKPHCGCTHTCMPVGHDTPRQTPVTLEGGWTARPPSATGRLC
jgi:hypothetical protein